MNDILQRIKGLQEEMRDCVHINNGGCGIFAYYSVVALRARNIKCRIRGSGYHGSMEELRNADPNNPQNWSYHGHIFVEVYHKGSWWAFDAKETVQRRQGVKARVPSMRLAISRIVKGSVRLEELRIKIYDSSDWNWMFERQQWEGVVKERIEKHFLDKAA